MVYNYKNCIKKFKSDYALKKALADKKIFKLGSGVYSDKKSINDFEFITFARPDAIFTLKTAFFIYGFTDEIPDTYDLTVDRLSSKTKYSRCKIKYYFQPQKTLVVGMTEYKYNGTKIKIYDKERLLVELFRYSTKIPFDLYKEIIAKYRMEKLDFEKLEKYISKFKNKKNLLIKLKLEVL